MSAQPTFTRPFADLTVKQLKAELDTYTVEQAYNKHPEAQALIAQDIALVQAELALRMGQRS